MRRRRQAVSQPKADINVTSLLDITFVLLIAFMIVAPALKHGIDLELPKVREAPAIKQDKPISLAVRSVDDELEITVDGKASSLDDMVADIQRLQPPNSNRAIALEGDRRVDWEKMSRVISALENGGIDNIGILTRPS